MSSRISAPSGPAPTGTSTTSDAGTAAMARFTASTGRIGPTTMVIGLLLSLAGPAYLLFFSGFEISPGMIITAYIAVAAVFGILWLVEPVTYFPVLGSAAMYQAFMIGNISSKLLPAAVVAQDRVGAKPGTARGDLAAVMAICGAAAVHLTSLLIFVGLLGTWLMTVIPAPVMLVGRTYILPAVMGAVLVQAVMAMKQARPTVIALAVALAVTYLLVPSVPALAMYATPIAVVITIALAWMLRSRKDAAPAQDAGEGIHY